MTTCDGYKVAPGLSAHVGSNLGRTLWLSDHGFQICIERAGLPVCEEGGRQGTRAGCLPGAHTSWPLPWVFLQSLASQFCRFTRQLSPASQYETEPWDTLHVKKYKPPGIFRPSVKQKCLFDESIVYSLPNTENSSLDFLLLGFKKGRKKETIYYVLHKALCLSGLAIN